MAETIIAYGEITILDLIDTATYIYYADNAEGDNPSATSEGKTHIGIYSGPALNSRPDEPDSNWSSNVWSGWQKYIGEDGSSITIISTSVMYVTTTEDVQPDDSANWQLSVPTTPQGSYLWTRTEVVYSDNSTTKAYSKTYLGKDANAYSIQTNQEEIFAFITSNGPSNERKTSPDTLQIKLYKLPIATNSIPIDFSENYSFGYIDRTGEYHSLITTEFSGYSSFINNIFTYNIQALSQLKDADNNWKIPTDVVFKFAYLENEEEIAIKPIPFRLGTSEDMAKFAVTAASINAAVGESKLEFNKDGLIIKNGCFEIRDNSNNSLLKYTPPSEDGVNGSLKITGNSEFTGIIHAAEGEFSGKISASQGDIGGFIITSDGLYSKEGIKENSDGYNTSGSKIQLQGKSGKIYAENITLGIGAQIDEYIQLGIEGKAFLRNPDKAEGKLLEAGGIELTQTGILKLGDINLNGATSTITGKNWTITPDSAEFKNINVSGKISTAIFEKNHIQSVGGSMIFKPSYEVKSYNKDQNEQFNTLILDKPFSGEIGNYVYLIDENGSIIKNLISVTQIKENTVVINPPLEGTEKIVSLIDIGKENSLIIGINSNDGSEEFLRPRGLTIAKFQTKSSQIDTSQNPKVFLGDLDQSNIKFFDGTSNANVSRGFGLYSENVYLTGSLTTQINTDSESTYAGINTLNSASATKFINDNSIIKDTSKIVFWAGATSMTNIVNAPFQVTEQGSLYASQGLFEGAIISRSIIKGSDIYAARIHGEGKSPKGLSFYDTNTGIVFYNGDPYAHPYTKIENFTEEKFKENKTLYYIYDDVKKEYRQCTDEEAYNSKISYYIKTVEKEVFSIGNDGLKYGNNNSSENTENNYFIEIKNGKTKFIGDEIQILGYSTNKEKSRSLRLKDNKIYSSNIKESNEEQFYANISLDSEEISFGLGKDVKELIISSNEIQLKKGIVKMDNTVLFGERLKYEQVSEGYNLYVL